MTSDILFKMCAREIYWLKAKIRALCDRKIAIFCSGQYAQKFNKRLIDRYDIEADFFIDNNPCFKNCMGIPVLKSPWNSIKNFADIYFVTVSSSKENYEAISKQLDEVGVPYLSSDMYEVVHSWERFCEVVDKLEDEISKMSYLGVIWYWLTYDNSYVQTIDDQYFAHKEFIHPTSGTIVDCGAFTGDTAEEYIRRSLAHVRLYCFEPNRNNFAALLVRTERIKYENALPETAIICEPYGISNKSQTLRFEGEREKSSISENGNFEISVTTIDEYFADIPVNLIKSDIEGEEMNLLKGAAQTIQKYQPKIAICIYHSILEFYEIPLFVKNLFSDYKLACRSHSSTFEETVLYCY
jgi:FkbM family methyltransferase